MLLLDTNILSALMLPRPPAAVMQFKTRAGRQRLVTASVCVAEILAGILVLPSGRRRHELNRAARRLFTEFMAGDVLDFDVAAAEVYAEMYAGRQRAGRPGATFDLMIGAIAATRGAKIVTRNAADFAELGIRVINPFED